MGRLDDKVVIVTGGAGGMGENHAREFVKEGAKVIITDIDEEKGEQIADNIGEDALFIKHDVTEEEQWKNVIEETENHFGPINGLVNNAAVLEDPSPIESFSLDTFKKSLSVNTIATFLGVKSVIPSMKKNDSGSIVNLSSQAGLVGNPDQIGYVSSKFAVTGMTRAAAQELGEYNIRVNSVHPGVVETSMIAGEDFEEAINSMVAEIPLQRVQTKEDVTNMILFLLSDESTSSTGSAFVVDGGITA